MTARHSHPLATHLGGALIALALASAPGAAAAQCGDGVALAPRGVRRRQRRERRRLLGRPVSSRTRRRSAPASPTHAGTDLARRPRRVAASSRRCIVTAPPSRPQPSVRRSSRPARIRIIKQRQPPADAVPEPRDGRVQPRHRAGPAEHGVPSQLREQPPRLRRLHRRPAATRSSPRYESSAGNARRGRRRPASAFSSSSPQLVPQPTTAASSPSGSDGRLYYRPRRRRRRQRSVRQQPERRLAARQDAPPQRRRRVAAVLPVPLDNPIPAAGPMAGLVWAKGVRNPRRFSFDRVSGDLYVGDVGDAQREEVDFLPPEQRRRQSTAGTSSRAATASSPAPLFPSCPAPTAGFTFPVREYDESEGCSVHGRLRLPRLRTAGRARDVLLRRPAARAFVRSFVVVRRRRRRRRRPHRRARARRRAEHRQHHLVRRGRARRALRRRSGRRSLQDRRRCRTADRDADRTPTATDTPTIPPTATETATATFTETATPIDTDTATPVDTDTPTPVDTRRPRSTPARRHRDADGDRHRGPADRDQHRGAADRDERRGAPRPTRPVPDGAHRDLHRRRRRPPPSRRPRPVTPATDTRTATRTQARRPGRRPPRSTPWRQPPAPTKPCRGDVDGNGHVWYRTTSLIVARALFSIPGSRRWVARRPTSTTAAWSIRSTC